MLTKLLKNKGIEEEKETKRKWSCYEFFLNCFLGKKNKDKVNIEDNETKIDLRRLKWDNTNIKHKPPPVECDTENTAKATFNSTKKEIGKKKGKNKNEKHSEMSGYEGDAGGRSSFSLPSTPIREQFSSPITDYETNQLLSPQRSWSATPKREEYSSYTLNETD